MSDTELAALARSYLMLDGLDGDIRALFADLQRYIVVGPPHETVEFYEHDGRRRTLTWEDGDRSVGIEPGYVPDEAAP